MNARATLVLTLLAVLLVPTALLAGCGGGDSDEDQIADAIESSVLSDNPADCTELNTQRFLDQTETPEGKEAVESCEENAESSEGDADGVEVTEVSADGEAGSALVTFDGSAFDGQTVEISLVKEDDQWKLDTIEDIRDFDVETFAAGLAEQVKAEPNVSEGAVSCIEERIASADPDDVEEVILSGSQDGFVAIIQACL